MKGQVSSARHELHNTIHDTSRRASEPPSQRRDYTYGIIAEVNLEIHHAKVLLIDEGSASVIKDEYALGGAFLPVVTQQSILFQLFGKLRPGLLCRVWWRGQHPRNAKSAEIEIIGEEEWALSKQNDQPNEVAVGPYKILGGGMETT